MPTRPNHVRAEVFTTFREAEERWRHYETLHDHYVYQTFDWTWRWFDAIGRHRDLTPCLVDVTDHAGTPLAFLPLAIEKRLIGTGLVWLGGGITDYHGPLLTADGAERLDRRALNTLWKSLRRQHASLAYADFSRQPAMIGGLANPFFPLGRAAGAERAMSTALSGDWPTYYAAKRGKKTRHNDRRKRRRLESLGRLRFTIATEPDEIEAQIAAMLAQKDRYVTRLGQLNVLRERGHDVFLARMASDPAVRERTLLCALELDGQILAVQWGVLHRRRFFSIVASYDDGDLARYSTGEILLRELIAWCFENDVAIVDFTCGEEPYKHAWCDRTLELQDRLVPLSPLGHVAVNARLAMTALRQRARSSEALRGAVAAVRGWMRNRLLESPSPSAGPAVGQHTGAGKS